MTHEEWARVSWVQELQSFGLPAWQLRGGGVVREKLFRRFSFSVCQRFIRLLKTMYCELRAALQWTTWEPMGLSFTGFWRDIRCRRNEIIIPAKNNHRDHSSCCQCFRIGWSTLQMLLLEGRTTWCDYMGPYTHMWDFSSEIIYWKKTNITSLPCFLTSENLILIYQILFRNNQPAPNQHMKSDEGRSLRRKPQYHSPVPIHNTAFR